jgi:hypothetical protein
MLEGGFDFLMFFRQRNPTLNPEQAFAAASRVGGRALGMSDATPGGHEIHRARRNLKRVSFAVAMYNSPVKQVGDRGEPDMGMGPDVQAMSSKELRRPHLIEKDEWPNHLTLIARQSAAHFKAVAQIADSRNNDEFQRITRSLIAEDWIGRGQPTHYIWLL